MANKVTVTSGQTLQQIAKANKTTVAAILADPANAVLAKRAAAGKTVVFNGTKVAIPGAASPAVPKGGGVDATGAVVDSTGAPVIPTGTVYKTAEIYDQYGNPVTVYTEGPNAGKDIKTGSIVIQGEKPVVSPEITVDTDAYAVLTDAFKFYGLESLVPAIKGYMQNNVGPNEAKLLLKNEQAYRDRFAGNLKRVAAGKNALDESVYLELENDYTETLRAYGLSDYFGVATDATSRLARQQKMAEVIGNDISAEEFKTRISTAVTRVKNTDANTKDAFKALYGIGDTDLIKFFLDPKQGGDELKIKATAAEISGMAVTAGLSGTTLGTAEELARLGVDKSTALSGYSQIAESLPRAEFLGQIYDETGITYGRTDAESEVFKGTASAKRKREQLINIEEASFSGASGRLRTGQQQGNTGSF